MPDQAEPTETELLISSYFAKRREVEALKQELAQIERKVIALGRGRYTGSVPGEQLTVAAGSESTTKPPTYELKSDDEEKARELAGDHFRTLFDRKVVFSPCEGFPHVAPKLLTPAKSRDIILLCEVPGKTTSGRAPSVLAK